MARVILDVFVKSVVEEGGEEKTESKVIEEVK